MFSFVGHSGHQYVHTFHFLCALELGFDLVHRFPGSISWLAEFVFIFLLFLGFCHGEDGLNEKWKLQEYIIETCWF